MFDIKMQLTLLISAGGSLLGTIWLSLTDPADNPRDFFIRSFMAITIGMVVGGASIQHFGLEPFVGTAVASVSALLSEQIMKFIRVRGKKLEKGNVDFTLKGDE